MMEPLVVVGLSGSTILDFGLFEVNVPREFTVPVYYYGVRKGFLHGVGVLETV